MTTTANAQRRPQLGLTTCYLLVSLESAARDLEWSIEKMESLEFHLTDLARRLVSSTFVVEHLREQVAKIRADIDEVRRTGRLTR